MNNPFLVELAVKNLFTHRLRTLLTILGMIIGISAIIFLVCFAFGIESMVTTEITSGNAFELIDVGTGNSQIIKIDAPTIKRIGSFDSVRRVEVIVNAAGKGKQGDKTIDLSLFGTSQKYMEWSGKKVKWGEILASDENRNLVIINDTYAKFLSGDNPDGLLHKDIVLDVIVPRELAVTGEVTNYSDQKFEVLGIIKDESSASAYLPQAIFDKYSIASYSQAKVQVASRDKAATVRAQIETTGLKTQYVGDTVSQVEQVFTVFKIILGSFGMIALIVAALGTFNTLTISLLERTKEVALMKILGMKSRDISKVFLTEAGIIGVIGGVLGIVTGISLGKIANAILNYFATRAGGEAVVIFSYPLWFLIGVFVFAVLLGFLTGLYPSRRAVRIHALDVLRFE
jgi:ABC-type antimicrobial peptide transport system permease subunit